MNCVPECARTDLIHARNAKRFVHSKLTLSQRVLNLSPKTKWGHMSHVRIFFAPFRLPLSISKHTHVVSQSEHKTACLLFVLCSGP